MPSRLTRMDVIKNEALKRIKPVTVEISNSGTLLQGIKSKATKSHILQPQFIKTNSCTEITVSKIWIESEFATDKGLDCFLLYHQFGLFNQQAVFDLLIKIGCLHYTVCIYAGLQGYMYLYWVINCWFKPYWRAVLNAKPSCCLFNIINTNRMGWTVNKFSWLIFFRWFGKHWY